LAGTLVSYQKGLSGSFTNGTHVTNGTNVTNTYINQEDTDMEPEPVKFKYIYNRDFPGMDLPLKLFSQVVDSIDNCTAMCNVGCDFVTYDAEKLCSIKYTDKSPTPVQYLRIKLRVGYQGYCGMSFGFQKQ
jgi:hypothetical protein